MLRRVLFGLLAGLALPGSAEAQFKGYFDVSHVEIPELKPPAWGHRQDGDRHLYLCVEDCTPPTGIEIKGIIRAENLPAAFESGPLSPAQLLSQGRANAERTGTRFLTAQPFDIGGLRGVHMEASAKVGGTIYFVTRWIGDGNRMLDVKVTAPDLELARRLSDTAVRSLVPQVFAK